MSIFASRVSQSVIPSRNESRMVRVIAIHCGMGPEIVGFEGKLGLWSVFWLLFPRSVAPKMNELEFRFIRHLFVVLDLYFINHSKPPRFSVRSVTLH